MDQLNGQNDFIKMPEAPPTSAARPSLDDIFSDDTPAQAPAPEISAKPSLDEIFKEESPGPQAAPTEKAEPSTYDKVASNLAAPTDIMATGVAKGYNTIARAMAGGLRLLGENEPVTTSSPPGHEQTSFFTDVANDLSAKTAGINQKLDANLSQYKKTTGGAVATDIATGAAQLPFFIGALAMAGPMGPAAMMGGSAFEDTYNQAMKSGKSHDEAFNIAGGVGAIQGALNSAYVSKLISVAEDATKPIINRILTQTANAAIFNAASAGSTAAITGATGIDKRSTADQVKDVLYQVAVGTPAAVIGGAPFMRAHQQLTDLGVKNADKVLEAVPEIRESLKNTIVDQVHGDNIKVKENPESINKTFDTLQAMKDGDFDKVSELVDNHGGLTPKVSTILERYKNRAPIPPEGVHYTDLKPDSEAFNSAAEIEAAYGYKLEPYPKPETEVKAGEEVKPTEKPVDEHKAIVGKAVDEGKPVPPEVLQAYPDIAEKAAVQEKAKDAELDTAITELEKNWMGEKENPPVVADASESTALETKLGNPDSMNLPSLGRLVAKLENMLADAAQTSKMTSEQLSALQDYTRRVGAVKDKLMRGSQTGAVDLSGLFEKQKQPWEMTPEDYQNIGKPEFIAQDDLLPKSKIFQPAKLSVDAKAMAGILREGKGEVARDTAQVVEKLNKYAKIVNALDPKEQLGLIDYMENRSNDMGVKIPDPALQVIADTYRDIYQSVEEAIKAQFPDAKMREDYFTHQYTDPKAAEKFFSDFIAKQGSGKNLRARAFPTLKEAMEFGLKPKTTNPGEVVGTYVANMNNFLATHRTLERMEQTGIAKFYEKGEQPEGWAPLDGNIAKEMDVLVTSEHRDPFIKPGRQLYAPENAARVYNNDISKGFGDPYDGVFEVLQKASNFATKISLLGPMHHFSTVTMGSMATDVARGAGLIKHGEIGEGLKAIGQGLTPGLSPAKNMALGRKVQEQYLGIDDHGPAFEKIVALGEAANVFHAQQQDYWKAGPAKDFVDSFKAGTLKSELKETIGNIKENPLTGSVEAIANGISKTADTISKPLFDVYVPLIKKGAFFAEMHNWLDKNPNASFEEQKAAARDIGDSMDNRFGEMMRDNLFWKKTTQQALQSTFLSYSWVAGGLRMLRGAPEGVSNLIRGRDITPDSKYLFGMAMTYAVYNGVMTYLHTGKYIDDWDERDLYSYRTGGKTIQGQPERAILPGHTMEFRHYLHDGLWELGNKINPGLLLLKALLTNKDWRGLPVTNENNSWFSKDRWGDYYDLVTGQLEPISEKTIRKGRKKGSNISTLEQVLAVRQAPEFVSDPEGYKQKEKARNDKDYKAKLRSDQRMDSQYENSDENNETTQ